MNEYKNVWAQIGKSNICKIKKKILSIEIDRTLSFDEYLVSLCRKALKKLPTLGRLSNLMCTY